MRLEAYITRRKSQCYRLGLEHECTFSQGLQWAFDQVLSIKCDQQWPEKG